MSFEQVLFEFIHLRSYERIVGMLIGGGAVFLGFMLFRSGIETPQSAIAKLGSYEFKFLKVAPGIFFSLFGVLLVGYITYEHPTLESISRTVRSPAAAVGGDSLSHGEKERRVFAGFSERAHSELSALAKPVNSLRDAVRKLPSEFERKEEAGEPSLILAEIARASAALEMLLNNKIFKSFPSAVFSACAKSLKVPEPYSKDVCEKIDELKREKL